MMKVLTCVLGMALVSWTSFGGLVDLANPFMGTDNTKDLSCGNLYPAIARPWGMNFWTPQTGPVGQGWLYDWKDRKILGFHQTHQPSPWVGDYGQFSLMPTVGKPVFTEKDRASWFSHKTESAAPHYYRVYLADHDVTVELTPTERAARFRVTYPETNAPNFVVDALDMGSSIVVDSARRRVTGVSRKTFVRGNEKTLGAKMLDCYFVLEFDHPFTAVRVWDGKTLVAGESFAGKHTGAVLTFPATKRGEQVNVRVASSFISAEQALRNLDETGTDGFDELLARGAAVWNEVLGRLTVEGGSETDRRKFYTCLYRSLLFPRQLHEYDAEGRPYHCSPYGKGPQPGHYYCDTGFWDTFRALFPLITWIYPERVTEIMEGFGHCLDESGWIPEWSAPYHRNCMIGQNSASAIADAFFAGCVPTNLAQHLYSGLVKATAATNPVCISVGRVGYEEYNRLGYVARDGITGGKQSAARTLEYAYADACIARMGEALGRPAAEVDLYRTRSGNWRNLFHPQHRLACGRALDGSWDPDFNPIRWGYDFTEGTPLHYTWSVFQDIPGLCTAMGGERAFEDRLDSVFSMPPHFDGSFFGGCTHEIREMFVAGFGQYAHGNQPIQHMIYLYDWCGAWPKAQTWARAAMDRLYRPTPDGYCGDEDNGQTSAWFVWSALGMYPVSPISGEYALGAPLFDRIDVKLPRGQSLVLQAKGAQEHAVFASANRNGKRLDRPFVCRADLLSGGTLDWKTAASDTYAREREQFLATRNPRVQERQIAAIRKAVDGARDDLVAVRSARNTMAPLPEGVEAEMVSPTTRLYRPKGGKDLPLLIYLHGGGWVIGSIASCSAYCGALAAKGVAVLAVDYPLAPEHPFPAARDAICAIYREVHANAKRYGCSPSRISLGGDSSGGNLSLSVALQLQREGLVPASLILYYPVTEARADGTKSWQEFATGCGMDAAFMDACNAAYLGRRSYGDASISPIYATDDQLRRLPPVYMLGADYDALRDQGLRFAQRLESLKCSVHYELPEGTTHLFVTVPGQPTAFRRAVDFAAEALLR